MAPNQAWSDLAEAVEQNDWGAATEIAENLAEWIAKGGLPPRITGRTEFERIVIRATVQSIATWKSFRSHCPQQGCWGVFAPG